MLLITSLERSMRINRVVALGIAAAAAMGANVDCQSEGAGSMTEPPKTQPDAIYVPAPQPGGREAQA